MTFLGGFIVFAALLLAAVFAAHAWTRRRLAQRFRQQHGADGKDLLLVYTESPHWRPYIEEHWLPRWSHRAVVLDRSLPWTNDQIEVQMWRTFGGYQNHTPLAIVVPRRGAVTVVRFFPAFRDFKHGRADALRAAEARLELALQKPERDR